MTPVGASIMVRERTGVTHQRSHMSWRHDNGGPGSERRLAASKSETRRSCVVRRAYMDPSMLDSRRRASATTSTVTYMLHPSTKVREQGIVFTLDDSASV